MGRAVRGGRTKDNRDMPHLKPVEKISLSDRGTKLRLAAVVLLIFVAAGAFAHGVTQWLGGEPGWTEIKVNSSSELNCGSEFIFQYELGKSGIPSSAEAKQITLLYSEAMVRAYQMFNNDGYSDDIRNIRYINCHPNEEIEVDEALYCAFKLCAAYDNRNLYLAPLYESYDSIFYCSGDWETESFDPRQNGELADFFEEAVRYAQDPAQAEVRLLGDNRIELYVSDAYLEYAEEEHISSFIDFYWMKNAFIADYIAGVMAEGGYTRGNISSYDGFIRNLDDSGNLYSFNLFDRLGDRVYQAAVMQYSGAKSIVSLRDYPMNSLDSQRYYEMADGQIRTAYLDTVDGLCRASLSGLTVYSESVGCAELLLRTIPVYIADSFDAGKLPEHSVYCSGGVIYHTDAELILSDLYADEKISYKSSCLF